mmetsp:Transcript_113051/g.258984  ORF Transcript_113051/g.258984 Transcript_113051/m.258984 type:complete len:361 (-) Transcript_113051:315-1397(-)
MATLIIGAGGAVGSQLARQLIRSSRTVIAADRRLVQYERSPLPPEIASLVIPAYGPGGSGVDIRDEESLAHVVGSQTQPIATVWNLAAPLSVESAENPGIAMEVTVGGMEKLLRVCSRFGVGRVCFTDSIGSFGSEAPRQNATAKWLVQNPKQDPGSDYGKQKRGCRELLKRWDGDSRFAVLPGLLHADPLWGKGTTEYALDAMLCATEGKEFVCPVPVDVQLPMVYRDDLIHGLVLLQDAEEDELLEPERGYCLPGFSFSALELFEEIKKVEPGFRWREMDNLEDGAAAKFSRIWPDSVSGFEASRDFGFEPIYDLRTTVRKVMREHKVHLKRRELPRSKPLPPVGASPPYLQGAVDVP